MKLSIVCVMLAVACFVSVNGQTNVDRTCRSCTITGYYDADQADNHCYDNATMENAVMISTVTPYCFTRFTLLDGIPTSVFRGPIDAAANDEFDLTIDTVPASPKCTTDFINGDEMTTCHHTCTTDNCNTITANSLMSCASTCTTNQGYCNYFTGQCVCNSGFSGTDCGTAVTVTRRSCVQCSQETDSTCATKTAGTACSINMPAANVYCTTTRTTLYDAVGAVVTSRITRGCTETNNFQDQCEFSAPSDTRFAAHTEQTCTSTCQTDNCNTGTPDGVVAAADRALYCVQCTGTGPSDCNTATGRTLCQGAANQCYSKIIYYYQEKGDLRHQADPDVMIESIERGCRDSTTSVNSCTNATLGTSSALRVTCEESCTEDGCNVGFPNRSKCVQCSTQRSIAAATNNALTINGLVAGYDICLNNPSIAVDCSSPAHRYCFVRETGEDREGFSREVVRGCSFFDRGNSCDETTVDGVDYKVCNRTCTGNGCNQGNGSVMPLQSLLMMSLPALIGYSLQRFFSL